MDYDFFNKKNEKEKNKIDEDLLNEIPLKDDYFDPPENGFQEDNFSPKFDFEPADSPSFDTNKPEDTKLSLRSTKKMSSDEYHQRLLELNLNAENKHYVLFFGKPASGKTFIIGSLLHYMKNILGGTVYLDDEKTTKLERKLFAQLQDVFLESGLVKKLGEHLLMSTMNFIFILLQKILINHRLILCLLMHRVNIRNELQSILITLKQESYLIIYE